MPSKFYGIAAAGRPKIFIGAEHGEIGRMLEENGCGFAVTPGDGEALVERILKLAGDRDLCVSLGTRARVAFERQWDKERFGRDHNCPSAEIAFLHLDTFAELAS